MHVCLCVSLCVCMYDVGLSVSLKYPEAAGESYGRSYRCHPLQTAAREHEVPGPLRGQVHPSPGEFSGCTHIQLLLCLFVCLCEG